MTNQTELERIDQEFDEKFEYLRRGYHASKADYDFLLDFLHAQIKEAEERERERISKLFENNDLYLFPVGLPRVEGVDEQGIVYKGLAIDPDQLVMRLEK